MTNCACAKCFILHSLISKVIIREIKQNLSRISYMFIYVECDLWDHSHERKKNECMSGNNSGCGYPPLRSSAAALLT